MVDRALTSVSATLRRDARGAKGRVKEWNEGLDSGIMARRMESHAVRAADEMPVARASESVAQGLGNGGAGGAAGDVALPLRGRREEEIEGEGNWEVPGVLEGRYMLYVQTRIVHVHVHLPSRQDAQPPVGAGIATKEGFFDRVGGVPTF